MTQIRRHPASELEKLSVTLAGSARQTGTQR